jgi:hypothetical protein
MTTINTMVKRISGLAGTSDVTDWEDDFINSIVEQSDDGDDTSSLTEKQINVIERIFKKHFSA